MLSIMKDVGGIQMPDFLGKLVVEKEEKHPAPEAPPPTAKPPGK
jgi:hypothetical protein